ncbi:Holliday junction branch migration DNA helicase RuvB [Staphylococcus aureus]
MTKAIERIKRAIANDEKILVYGDYDADGVTSTTILVTTLQLLGAQVGWHIPNRFTEGYGPNELAFRNAHDEGITLIITVDNGIQGHNEIKMVQDLGVDVIVTDHHEIGSTLPEAYAIVHPMHPSFNYPFQQLCGAGVAYKLAQALIENVPDYFKALVAIGTIADLVSLTDENRSLVTTLSNIIANEMEVNIRTVSGPSLERPGDLAAILSGLQPGDVLFIDEIHRLSSVVEEVLYPAMEDFFLDIIIGKGDEARSIRIDLPPFTLVGATTRAGSLTGPLRDRFGVHLRLEYYNESDLKEIIIRTAEVLGTGIDEESAIELAKRSRGTPRVANRLLKRVRDFQQVNEDEQIYIETTKHALGLLQVDQHGLDYIDHKMMNCIIKQYNGGPVGLDTIAVTIGEERITIEDVYEPFLIQKGFLERTPRGRKATPLAYEHFAKSNEERG